MFAMLDMRMLRPGNVRWLLEGDAANVFLGWQFFRFEAWHLPPGAARDFGQAIGSSIVYSDSIPLLALALKPFSALLPEHFQFLGLWMVACFALQGLFAWLVAGLVTKHPVQRAATALMLCAGPIVAQRAFGHFGLMAHWLLLAGFWLSLAPPRRRATLAWCVLLAVAALVQAYLLYMVLAIWLATWLRRSLVDRDWSWIAAVAQPLAIVATLLATLWIAGYFTLPGETIKANADLYGRYAADLNAYFNPQWGSRFLPGLKVGTNGFESYNYLGLGALALVAVAACAFALRRPQGWRRHVFLALAALAWWGIAVTNEVRLNDEIVLSFPLPESMRDHVAIVRSSGRFAWLLGYLLVIAAAACVVRACKPLLATAILCAAVVVQGTDQQPRITQLRQVFADRPDPAPLLRDRFWEQAARRYRHVVYVPVRASAQDWPQVGLFAADHRMTFNSGIFARVPVDAMMRADAEAKAQLAHGPLRMDTLYIVWPGRDEGPFPVNPPQDALDATIDGLHVVAPGWNATPR